MKQAISFLGFLVAISLVLVAIPFMLARKAYRKLAGKPPVRPTNILF